ncbi:ArsA-related P-loop ATPase [Okeania sp. SIO2B9]|uniref:ArsA-related P-loop ATPase n=1 Tax=Okeania sp. SIO2B9 TaxID=2607782 RepID=UPI00338D7CFF
MRVILMTGKGGVGKTSVAASTPPFPVINITRINYLTFSEKFLHILTLTGF